MPALDLAPDDIVDAARRLLAEGGIDGFSMRKLAAALDVNPMTIYLRFENKGALLDAIAAASLAEFAAPTGEGLWRDQVLELAVSLRAHLVRDRELLRFLHDTDRLSVGLLGALDRGLELMSEIAPTPEAAVEAFRLLFWHVVGSALVAGDFSTLPGNRGDLATVLAEAADRYPTLAAHATAFGPIDADELFVRTTDLLIDGLLAGDRETTP